MFSINSSNRLPLKACLLVGILCVGYLYVTFSFRSDINSLNYRITKLMGSNQLRATMPKDGVNELKYILQLGPTSSPFDMMGHGQNEFIRHGCKYYNCFVTNERDYFLDITKFDAVAFNGKYIPKRDELPQERSERQKYIFAATESAHNYRICDNIYDGYFNWTWTYRLDSDVRWAYITIYDVNGYIVGPSVNMVWPQLAPIGEELKSSLSTKTKMAAWFVSHCNTLSERELFVKNLQSEVQAKRYGWTVDVYGPCGTLSCPRSRENDCFNILKKEYYFYFSFENSFAEDYVTEKLLNALNNNAVPIVFGSANYSRFLPPGSYLDARELGVVKLAETMDAIYKNRTAYYDFFRWQNHFKYVHTIESDICNLCAALNDEEAMNKKTVYTNFRRWWNGEQWNENDTNC